MLDVLSYMKPFLLFAVEFYSGKTDKTKTMKKYELVAAVLLSVVYTAMAKDSAPKVGVYSRFPAEMGKPNTLICHLSKFFPPDISMDLLQDGKVMSGANQTHLTFEPEWQYHLTKFVSFTPQTGHEYNCMVTHMGNTKAYRWGE